MRTTFCDVNLGEWTDGLVSMLYRMINRPIIRNERRYLLFDGDVDALWIENMVYFLFTSG